MKLVNSNEGSTGIQVVNPWQLVTNPWPNEHKWPKPGPYCETRTAAVVTWFLQAALGSKIFWTLARKLGIAKYWVKYFFLRGRMYEKWTRNSSLHFLDASTYAYVDKENGTVTFCGHVHGLSPMNVAQIIKGIAGNPTAKRRINQILWREGAGTFLT